MCVYTYKHTSIYLYICVHTHIYICHSAYLEISRQFKEIDYLHPPWGTQELKVSSQACQEMPLLTELVHFLRTIFKNTTKVYAYMEVSQ